MLAGYSALTGRALVAAVHTSVVAVEHTPAAVGHIRVAAARAFAVVYTWAAGRTLVAVGHIAVVAVHTWAAVAVRTSAVVHTWVAVAVRTWVAVVHTWAVVAVHIVVAVGRTPSSVAVEEPLRASVGGTPVDGEQQPAGPSPQPSH